MYLDNHVYKYHDDLIIVTKNNHEFRYLTIIVQHYSYMYVVSGAY